MKQYPTQEEHMFSGKTDGDITAVTLKAEAALTDFLNKFPIKPEEMNEDLKKALIALQMKMGFTMQTLATVYEHYMELRKAEM